MGRGLGPSVGEPMDGRRQPTLLDRLLVPPALRRVQDEEVDGGALPRPVVLGRGRGVDDGESVIHTTRIFDRA